MPVFAPEKLAEWTGGKWFGQPVVPITGFIMDTRQLRAGQMFVALKTGQRDGHEFLETARSAGASAAIVAVRDAGVALPQLVVADPLLAFQAIVVTPIATLLFRFYPQWSMFYWFDPQIFPELDAYTGMLSAVSRSTP